MQFIVRNNKNEINNISELTSTLLQKNYYFEIDKKFNL